MNAKCKICGKDCRVGMEQVGVDNRGIPIVHRFSYCDRCSIKCDLDLQPPTNSKKKDSALSIWAAVLAFLGCTSFIGFILAIIDLSKKDKSKRHIGSGFAIIVFVLYVVMGLSSIGDDAENNSNNTNIQQTVVEISEIQGEEEETKETKIEVSVKEELVYDGNDVKIYLKSIEETPLNFAIKFQIENNSSLNLGFNAHAYSVNRIMTGNNIYEMDYDVAAGKKTVAKLEIDKRLLEELQVEKIETIDLLIWAYDNDKSFKEFDTGQIEIKTNLDDGSYKVISGQNIYEKDGIKVDFVKFEDEKITYCITNNTGNYFDFDVENITINDFTSSDIDYDLIGVIVLNGCQSIIEIEPSEEFVSLNEIEKIMKVEFDLNVRPMEDYFEDFKTDTIIMEF